MSATAIWTIFMFLQERNFMKYILMISVTLNLLACSPSGSISNPNTGGDSGETDNRWLIPRAEVFDGGPGKDGIPSLDQPKFISPAFVDFIADEELVIAVTFDTIIKVYPHSILDWHEIVNDKLDGELFALTYCPLTGTGVNWDRDITGEGTTFGVSGLLYNSNLIPYDRKTNSNWSQMRLDCVNGLLIESKIKTLALLETSWKTIKDLPNLMVLSRETGFSRNYDTYPYGDYRSNHNNIIFPVSNSDNRRQAKDRVLGVIQGDQVKTYSLETFTADTIKMVVDQLGSQALLILGNKTMNFITAYHVENPENFKVLQEQFPDVLLDHKGNKYNVFGRATSGPDKGLLLKQPENYMGYWFAWAAFYPDLELY